MRVLVGTNVFVSYLLARKRGETISALVEFVLSGAVTLLLPRELLVELRDVLTTRPYFTQRVGLETAEEFIETLRAAAELLPVIPDQVPRVSRDAKDDYLLAYALFGQADYLVTGDRDLLALSRIERLEIVTPARFVQLMCEGGIVGTEPEPPP